MEIISDIMVIQGQKASGMEAELRVGIKQVCVRGSISINGEPSHIPSQ